MGGVDLGGGRDHGKKGKKKKKKRIGIHMDMTPMVDIAFLLLTFFMLTTVFRKPQTLEIKLPPGSSSGSVSQTNLLILRIDEEGRLFHSKGIAEPVLMDFTVLTAYLQDRYKEDPNYIILLKLDRKAKYHYMVDMVDEFNLAKLSRYSVATLADEEVEQLKKIN
ncbi:MAG: biopolymer transport ExbD protein [Ignavibacteriales bacterium]